MGIAISGRSTPARICVAPLTAAGAPFRDASKRNVRSAIAISPNPSVTINVRPIRLGPSDRDAQVIAQNLLEILVVDAPGNNRRCAKSDRLMDGIPGHPSAADYDLVFVLGHDLACVEPLGGIATGHRDRPVSLASHAENPLDQRDVGFDDHALVGHDFDHGAGQIRPHLHGNRLAAQE